jgi:DNA-binding transcriptional regulator YiaG
MNEWTPKDIRTLRIRLKLSQERFGELLGVTRVYVNYLEKGVKTPSTTLKLLLNYVEKDFKGKGNEKEKGGTHGRGKGKKGPSKRDL